MDELYPPGPPAVADDLTAPGPAYKRQAKVALLSLLLFIALYLSLTGWFAWTAYSYFVNAAAVEQGAWVGYGFAAAAAFLTIFLLKALFFVNRGGEINDIEVTAEEEPRLFEFLHRLADEAGAPRPHRVFLSGRVNAAVFYDLTLLNLIFPSKKNLEIGLALVNGLNLGEFKAVLAHEFGHFRQGSMAVGRWVYVAQQIATHIIYQRDILDRFLVGLSSIDIRIAWIGWVLRLIVWALRAILDTAFSLVVLAQRSLSREMEFHADMVSVSLTGSDALVHALHRLGAADDAWERALGFAGQELAAGRAVTDVFVIQKIVTQRMKDILDDENYDCPPPLPEGDREGHRVFDAEDAQPPKMWSTHPPNHDRENNAKKQYIAANIDERPAWDVFADPQQLRERMTEHLLTQAPDAPQLQKSPVTESVSLVNQQYTKKIFDRRYRGSYMGRSVVREYATADEAIAPADLSLSVQEQFATLYPHDLSERFEHWRNLEQERETLRALRDGLLEPPDGIIRHRGVILKRKELPEAIEETRAECDEARRELCEHDRKVRGVHNAAAASLGSDWQAYHTGLVQLLHYADHSLANLADVQARLANLWAVITADGKISSGEVKQLLHVAKDLYSVLASINTATPDVRLSSDVAQSLGVESWNAALAEEFNLPEPNKENIGDWLGAAEGWMGYYQNALAALQTDSLETLLAAEARIEQATTRGVDAGTPASPAAIPAQYPVLLPNTERKLQRRLGLWDRFQTATGFFPALARFGVATTIVGGLLGAGMYSSSGADITVYNGLATAVTVTAVDETVSVAPLSSAELSVSTAPDLVIQTHTRDGLLVETLEVDASNSFSTYVYNVASAMPLVRWKAVYGSTGESPPVFLGAQPWLTANVDYLFEEPPESINTSGSGGSRSVLSEFPDFDPRYIEDYFPNGKVNDATILSHATWDHPNAPYTTLWLAAASEMDGFDDVLSRRLQRDPNDVLALRFEQETAGSDELRADVCERHAAQAAASPGNYDWQYLTGRCSTYSDDNTTVFLDLYAVAPDNQWVAAAAGYEFAEIGQWEQALTAWESAYATNAGMRVIYGEEIARARRMLHGTDADISDLVAMTPWLQMQQNLQSEEMLTTPGLAAYQLLLQGDLEGAIADAEASGAQVEEILRLAAASDGASGEMIAAALDLDPSQGINQGSIWIAVGLAMRHGRPVDELLLLTDLMLGPEAPYAREFFASLPDASAAEAALRGARSGTRGGAYAAGTVALGQRAPERWREGAKRLLFITERPYFR
ncbi:MAG: M48 family metallopeptidase [Gammaproteobacteria bacterium]|nr:M48 family metallopeptidase [Gammaproteobacteria bacterium]